MSEVASSLMPVRAELGALGWLLLILLVTRLGHWTVALTATAIDVRRRRALRADAAEAPAITGVDALVVLVPAYNEAAVIEACLRSLDRALLAVPGLHAEVVVVDDGSADATAERAEEARAHWRSGAELTVLSMPNRGKAGALNAGLAAARTVADPARTAVLVVDADSRLHADGLPHLLAPFAAPTVVAVSGNVRVGNRGAAGAATRLLTTLQHVEYVIGLDFLRRAQAVLGCVLTVPGAAGAFRLSAVQAVGGFPTETLAEDTDLTLRLQRAPGGPRAGRVVVAPEAVCETEVPESWKFLYWQRRRWMLGNLQCAWRHRAAMHPWRKGFLGGWALPGFVVGHVGLGFGPLLLILAGAQVATGRGLEALVWTGLALGLDVATGALAFTRAGEPLRQLAWVPLQRLAFLGFGAVVFWGMVAKVVRGRQVLWRKLPRVGLGAP